MSTHQGFGDLRLNHQRDQSAESFWPSFTDIMTVIVMIFMLAMLILLVRNMELVKELRATMEAERHAAALARSKDQERGALAEQLAAAQAKVRDLSQQLEAAGRESGRQKHLLAERQQALESAQAEQAKLASALAAQKGRAAGLETQLAALQQEQRSLQARSATQAERIGELEHTTNSRQAQIDRLTNERRAQAQAIADLKKSLQASSSALDSAQAGRRRQAQTLEELQSAHAATVKELADLRSQYEAKVAELSAVLDKLEKADSARAKLGDTYDQLKARYDRLVRPARSPNGHYVVEVRYSKEDGYSDIRMREPADSGFHKLSRAALDARLAALAKAHPEGLYVKVIFPKKSGLSYQEAWQFTRDLHAKYDYYYRDQPHGDAAPPSATTTASGQ